MLYEVYYIILILDKFFVSINFSQIRAPFWWFWCGGIMSLVSSLLLRHSVIFSDTYKI